jgi:C4-type Zn-finger protein
MYRYGPYVKPTYTYSFREIIIMAFECPHCGFRNNELQSAGVFNERGHTISLSVKSKDVSISV